MAAVWLDADVPAVERAARLVAKDVNGLASAAEMAELRQLEDRLGLSPMARRRLQWEVERAAPEAATPAKRSRSDEERRLRLVSGE
jgi:hypothetical protein